MLGGSKLNIFGDFFRNFGKMSKNLKMFMWCVFLVGIIISSTNVLLNIYYKDLGFSESIIGNLMSIRTIGTSLGAIVAMFLVEKIGSRKSLYVAFIGMAVSGLAFVNILYMPVLQVSSMIFGISQGIFTVQQSPILRNNSKTENVVNNFSASFVISNGAMFFGNAIFGIISDTLSSTGSQVGGRMIALNLSFIFMATSVFAISRMEIKDHVAKSEDDKITFKKFASALDNRIKLYLVKVSLVGIGAGLTIPFFSVYIQHALQTTDTVVGVIMSISQVGTVLGGLVIPSLTNRFGRVKTIIACQLLSIPFLLSISFPQGIIILTISFFFRSSFMNMANPLIESLSMDLVDEKYRTMMSSIFLLTNFGFRAIGTSIGGYMMENISYNAPYYFTIMFYMLSTLLIYIIFGKGKDKVATQ